MYSDFITKNSSAVSQIESALRSLTYIIPGTHTGGGRTMVACLDLTMHRPFPGIRNRVRVAAQRCSDTVPLP
jgi:hypothetical protein